MATIEFVRYQPMRSDVSNGKVHWRELSNRKVINRLPQIIWANHMPWREANLWALQQATRARLNIKTVASAMAHIHAYAKWLESEQLDWWYFPAREADRCLVRFRGALMDALDQGAISPSTAQQRMAAVVRFYRWLTASRLLSAEWPMWKERHVGIRIMDSFGLERTLIENSTDLAITNRKRPGEILEDGLLPVSVDRRNIILNFAKENASKELWMMLRLGFRTGMRVGTITDLRIGTLDRATPDPLMKGWFRLAIGPGAHPPVHTKYGVTGQVFIEGGDLQMLKDHFYSVRRLKRQAMANASNRDLLFLTRFGSPYSADGADTSRAINVEMSRLRKAGISAGINEFHNFHFHQSRCTFATELARMLIKHANVSLAIQVVKEALLHKDEATTLKYIRFIEKSAAMAEVADAFTRSFLGLAPTVRID